MGARPGRTPPGGRPRARRGARVLELALAAMRIGIATALALIVAAQLVLGLLLDPGRDALFGRAGTGALLLVAGAYLITSR